MTSDPPQPTALLAVACTLTLIIAACQPASGLPGGSDPTPARPSDAPTPSQAATPQPLHEIALAAITDPELRISFDVSGAVTRAGIVTAVTGRLDIVDGSTRSMWILGDGDGRRPAAATTIDAVTHVQDAHEVAWFEESASYPGLGIAETLAEIERLAPLPDADASDGLHRFEARGIPEFVHVPPLTEGVSGVKATLEVLVADNGSVRSIVLAETWVDGALELKLDRPPRHRVPEAVVDPSPILERYTSTRLGYTIGIFPGSAPMVLEDLHPQTEGEGFPLGDGRFLVVLREDQRRTATIESYEAAFVRATLASGETFERSGDFTIVGSETVIPTYMMAPTEPEGVSTAFALFVHGRYGYLVGARIGDASTSEAFLLMFATTFQAFD